MPDAHYHKDGKTQPEDVMTATQIAAEIKIRLPRRISRMEIRRAAQNLAAHRSTVTEQDLRDLAQELLWS